MGEVTDRTPDPDEIAAMTAYEMAATVEFGLDASRDCSTSAPRRRGCRLLTRLFRAAVRRLDFVERAQARARSNGKVRFGP